AVSGAVTAGLTALASQAAVALINNQGDVGKTLHDLGSSASVKSLLTAIVTGGVLGGLNMNPTGLPTAGAGSQEFLTQLGQNLQAGAARALIDTAINGGSLEDSLKSGLKAAILDTVAAQAANAIGGLSMGDDAVLDGFTNKVAHAIAGCAVGAVRADNAGGCGAGALGAAVGEMAAEAYGRQIDTTQFAAMLGGIAVAIAGGDATQINLASQAGANAAANNYLNHTEAARLAPAASACNKGNLDQCRVATNLIATSDARDDALVSACLAPQSQACSSAIADFKIAQASYAGFPALNGTAAFRFVNATLSWVPVGSMPDTTPGEVFHGCGGPTNVCVVTSERDPQGNYIFRPASPLEAAAESGAITAITRDAIIRGAIDYGLDAIAIAAAARLGSTTVTASDVAGLRIVNGEVLNSRGTVIGRQDAATGLFVPATPPAGTPPGANIGSQSRLNELTTLFDKQNVTSEISLYGRTYTATVESNRTGTTKVFNTTNLSDAQLEAQAKAYVNDLTGGAALNPVAGNPPNVWLARLADGTTVNLRSVSSSVIGATGREARWTIDVKDNPQLAGVIARDRVEIKFK
ncbi:DUF637 domain-containing protein, partial [Variovorax humicola]